MQMKLFINPYKKGSKSVSELKAGLTEEGLNVKLIKKIFSRYVHKPQEHLVVNWGDSGCKEYENMLNKPSAVSLAANKLHTFITLKEQEVQSVPAFTEAADAVKFLEAKPGRSIYCRTKLSGSQGDGIVLAKTADEIVPAKLYTGGLTDKKRKEFRVHVFKDDVLHVQQKRRRNGYKENPDFSDEVRNIKGGWIFGIQDVVIADETKATCVTAVKALGLDFGAVDVLETPNGKGWVLEVNTACGLEGTTVSKYVAAIKDYAAGLENRGAKPDVLFFDEAPVFDEEW
jgi:hypothetical protein